MSEPEPEDALTYARKQVAWYRDHSVDVGGKPVRYLDPRESERLLAGDVAAGLVCGTIPLSPVLRLAKAGDPLFYDALCSLAADQLKGERQLREPLRSAVAEVLDERPRVSRTRRPESNIFRDFFIVELVKDVRERFSLPATGRSEKRPSACAIAAEALGMTYDAVRKVFDKSRA